MTCEPKILCVLLLVIQGQNSGLCLGLNYIITEKAIEVIQGDNKWLVKLSMVYGDYILHKNLELLIVPVVFIN